MQNVRDESDDEGDRLPGQPEYSSARAQAGLLDDPEYKAMSK